MNELYAILDAWRENQDNHQSAVLATVVHVKGSAYRRPGARMLILPDGRRIGSISGGCLEGDISKKAWWLTTDGSPTVRVYDTSSEDDAVWEFGLGCNGIVHVLLERVQTDSACAALQFLDECRATQQEAVMVTVIRATDSSCVQVGDRLFVQPEGRCTGTLADSPVLHDLFTHAANTFAERKSRLVHLADCEVFIEWVGQPTPLVVFGAGHDAIPLVAIAKQLGWHVTVADGRPAYAKADRFPGVDRVVLLKPHDLLASIDITPNTVVVLMTHNYPQDGKLLRRILPKHPRYLGLLGPRNRSERLYEEIGEVMDESVVHAPVGLDIGGDTPATIALSIVAEIQTVLAGHAGGMLKNRKGSIHTPVHEVGKPVKALIPAFAAIGSCEVVTESHG